MIEEKRQTGFADRLQRAWYKPGLSGWVLLFVPLALLYAAITALRRRLYRSGLMGSTRLPVATVVVGNVSVGGSGKTPLTLFLAQQLRDSGYRPGIISRGYGGSATVPTAVDPYSNPAEVGDEPVLMAQGSGVPVFVARRRADAGKALLAAHPEVNVLLCDDGLQHYALQRDVELCVIDAARGLGNGWLLPAGPLRENRQRLAEVGAVVVNGGAGAGWHARSYGMQLQPGAFQALSQPTRTFSAAEMAASGPLHAVCGIGNPARFFATLLGLGLRFTPHAMPDHHNYQLSDLPADGLILVTAKDAVKLAALPGIAAVDARIRVLPVHAQVDAGLIDWLTARIDEVNNGRQTA
ncbi:tetraacyldisaccharide 4'-kinase [Amantichitinum ursilacus]|uniref:Tetraacyldisaccharide 4'-kinase n=1 Tax=Amantichitinum ursilacus TaxID=857265 RepID=A0A0N0XFK6_9NEIS|nr:tetraacyldisaccharide 4'-kinase [Amantichitinum ursilacus]KPC49179.1 Tetraacyldisaccharide 4'-kinase [Amantichitinum ursilacus]